MDLKIQLDDNVKISEKEINELKDSIKEKTEKEEIDKTVSQWVLENNPFGKNGETMLHSAAKNGNVKLCEMILDNLEDDNKNPKSKTGMTPLHYAAESGHVEIYRMIIEKINLKCNFCKYKNPKNKNGITPSQLAELNGHSEITRFYQEIKQQISEQRNENCSIS